MSRFWFWPLLGVAKRFQLKIRKKDKQHASTDSKIYQIKSSSREVIEETIDAKEKDTKLPVSKLVALFPQRLNMPKQITTNQEIFDIFK